MPRLRPPGLRTRFTILLLAALVMVNAIAALLLAREGSGYDRAIRLQGDMGRLVALVGALEEVDRETGTEIIEHSSTGFTRFSVEKQPLAAANTHPDAALTSAISRAIPDRAVHVAAANSVRDTMGQPLLTMLSVQLAEGTYRGEWLNALVYPLPQITAWKWKAGFFVPLAASFVGTLVVGLLFIRRMTDPLRQLARAARAAGRGDRSVRVPEAGAHELRDAAAAFNDMQQRIADFDKERARLVASLGHDLRTPITSLRIRVEMLDDPETQTAMIRTLDDMTVMSEDLMRFVHDARTGEPARPTDLVALLRCLCAERAVPFAPDSDAALVLPLRVVAITRAVDNLIGNALRYAHDARVRLTRENDEAVIVIEDDGPGIDPALIDRICEPFLRGEDSRSVATGGMGLGLSIARAVAADHGGTLLLANAPQGGLRVQMRLPVARSGLPDLAANPIA